MENFERYMPEMMCYYEEMSEPADETVVIKQPWCERDRMSIKEVWKKGIHEGNLV